LFNKLKTACAREQSGVVNITAVFGAVDLQWFYLTVLLLIIIIIIC